LAAATKLSIASDMGPSAGMRAALSSTPDSTLPAAS
jgi:hypothetical protein